MLKNRLSKRIDSLTDDESGNITVAFVAMTLIIAVLFAAVMDFGMAFAQHNEQENDLAIALDATKTSASGLLVKNSDWPEKQIATEIVTSLRTNGCNDAVSVWVKEAPASQVNNSARRAIAVYVEVTGSYSPISAGNVIGQIGVASNDGCYLVPYSADTAWRPATSRAGCYKALANGSNITYENKSVPSQVNDLISAAIEEINK